ncbi:tetratricopeptide repeat protein [Pyxidicoccus parkwayensis]|uniref:Tetratricopeptide repeat protein n=1 Tax=Pyxidicoccus parkwayensis TaxID=2813578 RepID=A0ABX7P949_9BACT|nr:tetratricopeptide repeat protein [Pyxidicoccus parkwaysis]QSQ27019.1 tetratricopeptide repeat protein [Pyxidicoccus parkwaysis]
MSKLLFAAFSEGVNLSMAGNHEAAILAFDKVLAVDPKHVPALTAKGSSLVELGRTQEALACFERAIEVDPNAADPHRDAALCQLELGEPEAASERMQRAVQLNPVPGYREAAAVEVYALGNALLTRGSRRPDKARYRQARHVFELALELSPAYVEAAKALADVWEHLGDTAQRDHYAQLAIRLRPVGG